MAQQLLDETLRHFKFLVKLRNSGATNMWGASPYLQSFFGIDQSEAKDILISWIQSFDLPEDEQPDDGR